MLASAASGRSLSLSSQTFRGSYASVEFAGGFGTTTCQLTLEGSLHSRTIEKVPGSLIGYITRAILRKPCAQGDATILTATLPWHIRYSSFTGTLPDITSVNSTIVGLAFRALEPVFGLGCLARSTPERPVTFTNEKQGGNGFTSSSLGGSIPTDCGLNGTIRSRETRIEVLGATTRITVLLI